MPKNKIVNLRKPTEVEREDRFIHGGGRGRAGLTGFVGGTPGLPTVVHRHSVKKNLWTEASFHLADQVIFPGTRGRRLRSGMRPNKVVGPYLYEKVCRVIFRCWATMGLQNGTRSVIEKLFAFCTTCKRSFRC
jgi:hypothetical protein